MLQGLRTFLVLCCCCLFVLAAQAKTVQLKNARVVNAATSLQVVFEFSDQFTYHAFGLKKPERLVIDIQKGELKSSLKSVQQQFEFIGNIRSGGHQDAYLRLVFDLTRPVEATLKIYKKTASKPDRLVVEFPTTTHAMMSNTKPPIAKQKPSASHQKVVKTTPVTTKKRDIIVVIDPGHGGKDPGAHGVHGAREKNVVLQISKRLQQMINKEPGFKAILTRKGDYYIGLRRRLSLAHKYKADMFVAIHADAYRHQRAHGASVYALSERGATSEAARWLAQNENKSEFVGGLDLADKDHLLRSVLIDLSQTHTIGSSLQMGSEILNHLSQFASLHHPGVEQAAFVVLKSPDIPSLLVETGFLSNPGEEEKLVNPWYQQRIASAVMQGIKGYFMHHPPRGTRLAHDVHHPHHYRT